MTVRINGSGGSDAPGHAARAGGRRPAAWRTAVRVSAVVAVGAVVLAGCQRRPTPPTSTTTSTTTTTTTGPMPPPPGTGGTYAQELAQAAPGTVPWFCNAAGNGSPLSGHGNGAHTHPIYEGKTKGALGAADCATLAQQLDAVVAALRPWATRGEGEAAGWKASAEYIEGLGTHHVFGSSGITSGFGNTSFDPVKPQFLIYGGSDPQAPLMGVSYGAQGATPPAAFAGTNDWWHLHKKICLDGRSLTYPPKILAGAEEIADSACTALGGFNAPVPGGGIWLLHVWLQPPYQYRLDLFASGHNCLLQDRIAADTDPCWALARRDPALGLPAGSGGGDHGGDHGH